MKLSKLLYNFSFALPVIFFTVSCKKELNVIDPNSPNISAVRSESGLVSFGQGAVYLNGFNGVDLGGLNTLGTGFFSNAYQYHELMADVISATASNQNINVVNLPSYAILDDGTTLRSTASQRSILRISNARSARSSNAFYYEWAYMYSMNNACNNLLAEIPGVKLSGDSATKANTLKAWGYYWKGYAYSRLGSLYYAGLINNKVINASDALNNKYVDRNALIAEANKYLDSASYALSKVTSSDDYTMIITGLIPSVVQNGHGLPLSVNEWLHSINTLEARNLLVNKKFSDMTTEDWNAIINLTNNGVQSGDNVFTARTALANSFVDPTNGSVAAQTTGSSTFAISERFIQEYFFGDKRLDNNFIHKTKLNSTGGYTYSTRYRLVNKGNGLAGVIVYSDRTPGNYEIYTGGSYEENALMKAEALINTGKVDQGLAIIDAVRAYQGAGLSPLAGTALSTTTAEEVLRRERRVALVFRGLSFYDYRRFGFIYDVSKGGGRRDAVVLSPTGELNQHATINYDFLDYFDVPTDETDLNPPGAGSAPTVNPN